MAPAAACNDLIERCTATKMEEKKKTLSPQSNNLAGSEWLWGFTGVDLFIYWVKGSMLVLHFILQNVRFLVEMLIIKNVSLGETLLSTHI